MHQSYIFKNVYIFKVFKIVSNDSVLSFTLFVLDIFLTPIHVNGKTN